jgi:hypothetical protein
MAATDSLLITVDGSEPEVSQGTVRRPLDTSARFWLEVADMDKTTADALLRETFGFHRWQADHPAGLVVLATVVKNLVGRPRGHELAEHHEPDITRLCHGIRHPG